MSSSGKQIITIIIFPNKIQQIITGQQIITMHIFSNISKSGGNQSMKFGQLIEYDKKNIFLEKSYTKRRASPRTFSETLKSLGQVFSFIVCFNCVSIVNRPRNGYETYCSNSSKYL